MSKLCSRCGAELPNEAAFCPHCTASLLEKQIRKPSRRSGRWGWLLAALCVLLAAVAIGVWGLTAASVPAEPDSGDALQSEESVQPDNDDAPQVFEPRLILSNGVAVSALHLYLQGGESDLRIEQDGALIALTDCESGDEGVALVEIVDQALRVTPVAVGSTTVTVTFDAGSYIFPVEVAPLRLGIRIGNQTYYAASDGRVTDLGTVNKDDLLVVVCNDEPIADFTVEGHTDHMTRFRVEDGQLIKTPLQYGKAMFTILYGQSEATFSGFFEDLSRMGVQYGEDCEAGDGGHLGAVYGSGAFVVTFDGKAVEDFTVVGYNAEVATVANEDGLLKITAEATGMSEFMLSYPYGNGNTEYNTFTVEVLMPAEEVLPCGENTNWSLSAAGVLTIFGTGAMGDFNLNFDTKQCEAPWYDRREEIRSIVIENGVTRIGGGAFYNCTELVDVSIPNSVTEIGWGAFASCKRLPSVRIPEGVTEIDSCAFAFCNELVAVVVPGSVRQLRQRVFYDCWMLIDVQLGEGILSIGNEAFRGCFEMTEIVIPASVETISADAFPEGVRLLDPQGK